MDKLYFKLHSLGYVEVDDAIWFPNVFFNAIVKINKYSGQIEMLKKFPNYEIQCQWLYSTVCYINGKLIFIPGYSKEVASYDIKSQKFTFVTLDTERVGNSKKLYFFSAYVYDKYVYMLPRGAKCIVRYDTINHSVKYLGECLNREISVLSDEAAIFVGQFEILNGKLYIPFEKLNAIAIFDPVTESIDIRYLNIKGGCSTINYIEGHFYLASSEYPVIYKWTSETGMVKEYKEFPKTFDIGKGNIFIGSLNIGDKIYFFPDCSNMIISFDYNEKKISIEQVVDKIGGRACARYFIKKNMNQNGTLITYEDKLCSINSIKNGLYVESCFLFDDIYKRQISNFLLENAYYDLFFEIKDSVKQYVDILVDATKEKEKEEGKNIGKHIFKQLEYI